MAGEADVADLAGLFRIHQCLNRTAIGEYSIRVVEPQDFVELHQIDAISFQSRQRFIELRSGRLFSAAVDLGHQKGFIAIAALGKCRAHPFFAVSMTVVPGVIQKIDAAIESRLNQLSRAGLGHRRAAQMSASEAYQGYFFAGTSKASIWHIAPKLTGTAYSHKIAGIQ
jgi:hypothetical protein